MSVYALLERCKQDGVTVALTNGNIKVMGKREPVSKYAPLLKTRKAEIARHLSRLTLPANPAALNDLFRFDLVQDEIAAGYSEAELRRTNNMAWEFMQADGMTFQDAIKKAAEIVINTQIAACEAAYVDVMALFERISK